MLQLRSATKRNAYEEPTRKVSDEPSQHYGKPSWEASQLCFTFSVEEPARLSQPVSRMRVEITL
jgi:hypothetical protein